MVERGFIHPERQSINRPMYQFCNLTGYTSKFISDINNFPEWFTDEEKQSYYSMCEKYGYYYNCISSAMNTKDLPLLVLTGNWEKYARLITTIPIMISKDPEHFQYMKYTARCIVCCNKLPDNEYECIDLPVIILDHSIQYIWSQINSPSPETTVKVLELFLSEGFRWKRQIVIK